MLCFMSCLSIGGHLTAAFPTLFLIPLGKNISRTATESSKKDEKSVLELRDFEELHRKCLLL